MNAPVASESTADVEAREREEDRQRAVEEDRDDGRSIDWIWIEAGGGVTYVNLKAIKYDNFLPGAVDVIQTGGGFTAAVGMKFLRLLAFGARVSYSVFDSFSLGTVGAEIGLRVPIAFVEPYIRAGVGYAWTGAADYALPSVNTADVFGFNVTLALGIDFYIGKFLSIGAGADAYLLNLTRDTFDADITGIPDFDLTTEGHAVGLAVQGQAHATLHF